MTDLIVEVERSRRLARMSQQAVARDLGMTQGHYSKVARAVVPISAKISTKLEAWLKENRRLASPGADPATPLHMAAEIKRKCMEIMHLAEELAGPLLS